MLYGWLGRLDQDMGLTVQGRLSLSRHSRLSFSSSCQRAALLAVLFELTFHALFKLGTHSEVARFRLSMQI